MSDTVEIPVALFERAASSLAGRPVCVRFQPTEVEGAVGQAYNLNGDAIIDVDDRKLQDTPSHLMSVYLHEVAHCANFQDIPLTHTIGAPGSIKGHRDNPLTKTLEYIDHEVKADNQAAVWLSWAERRYRE